MSLRVQLLPCPCKWQWGHGNVKGLKVLDTPRLIFWTPDPVPGPRLSWQAQNRASHSSLSRTFTLSFLKPQTKKQHRVWYSDGSAGVAAGGGAGEPSPLFDLLGLLEGYGGREAVQI